MYGKTILSTDLYGLGKTLLFLLTGQSPEDLPNRKRKINVRSFVNISPQFADWIEYLIEPKISQRCPNAQTALDILLERQIQKVRQPSNSSVKIIKNDEIFNIYIPPAITRKTSNILIGYLGLGWTILLFSFIIKYHEFYIFSNILGTDLFSLFIVIPLLIMFGIAICSSIYPHFPKKYGAEYLPFYLISMNFGVFYNYRYYSPDVSLSIILLTTGILLTISEFFWGNRFRKGSLKDLLFKTEIHIYKDSIYLYTYFFNRLVDSTYIYILKDEVTRIITNSFITLEHEKIFGGTRKESYNLGLLLTKEEKKWLVSEINNNLD